MNDFELTPDQERELRMLRAHFPYRITFAAKHPKTGECQLHSKHTRHTMNRLAHSGYNIFQVN
jgi:hypothetical protein